MVPFSDNRADIIWKVLARDRLVNSGIFLNVETGCQAGDKFVPASQGGRTTKQKAKEKLLCSQKKKKTTTRMLWLFVKSVPHSGCVSQDSDALVSQRVKRGKQMQSLRINSTSTVHWVYTTSSKYPGKTPSLGKRQVGIPHQRSPYAVKFEDRSHKLKENDKTTFYSPAEEWVSWLRQQKSWTKKSLLWIPERVCILCWVGDHEDIAESDDGGDGQRRCANKRRGNSMCQRIGLIRDSCASWRNSRSSFSREADCNISNYAPFVVPGLPTNSPSTTPTPPLLHHPHHKVLYLTSTNTLNIQHKKEVEIRVKSFGETRCMNPQKPKTKMEMVNQKKYKEMYRMNCLIGYRNSKRIWMMQVVLWTHGENLSMDVETLPVHHNKLCSEGSEPRNNHQYVVLVQDLAKQCLQSYPCETKTSQETPEEPKKSSWSRQGKQKSFTMTIPQNLTSLVGNNPGIIARQHHIDHKQMGLLKEQCAQ